MSKKIFFLLAFDTLLFALSVKAEAQQPEKAQC